jgi:outer membrane protein OmpA-like peptidoglycan-associated protein
LLLFSAVFAGTVGAAETEPFVMELSPSIGGVVDGQGRINGLAKSATAAGVGAGVDFRFLPFLAGGVKFAYGSNFDIITHLEAQAFVRYYFLRLPNLLNGVMLFAQVEGGMAVFWENQTTYEADLKTIKHRPNEAIPAPDFSASLGARFALPKNFFVEPYVRGGWPLLWGAGLSVGYSFPLKRPEAVNVTPRRRPAETPPAEEPVEETPVEEPPVPAETGPDEAELEELAKGFGTIYFFDNRTDLTGVDAEKTEANIAAFDHLADFLTRYPDYKVTIEGFANAAQTEPKAVAAEERMFLKPISQGRAETVLKELTERGIDSERLTAVGQGGSKPVAEITDKPNLWKNRRVEFTVSK